MKYIKKFCHFFHTVKLKQFLFLNGISTSPTANKYDSRAENSEEVPATMPEKEPDTAFLLGQIVSDIKNIKDKLDEFTSKVHVELDDHEERITSLEGWKREILAYAAAVSLIVAAVWSIGGSYIQSHVGSNQTHEVSQTK